MMTTYLIDCENVSLKKALPEMQLKKNDKIHFFFSSSAAKPSFDDLYELENRKIKMELHKAVVGEHNALDVQLSSFLGYRLRFNFRKENFCIISKDKAFLCLQEYWKAQGKTIDVIAPKENVPEPAKKYPPIKPDVVKTMPGASTQLNEALRHQIKNHKKRRAVTAFVIDRRHSREDINVYLTKQFQGKELRNINSIIAPFVKGR